MKDTLCVKYNMLEEYELTEVNNDIRFQFKAGNFEERDKSTTAMLVLK